MNPFSAFSFGKIIKTFIPGILALGAPWCVVEILHFMASDPGSPQDGTTIWRFFFDNSLLVNGLDNSARVTFAGIAIVPIALIMGFFLNTLHWLCVHSRCWSIIQNRLDEEFSATREALDSLARIGFKMVFANSNRVSKCAPQVYLPGFLMPLVDLQKWIFLRESYFSWYEFQMNSVFALCASWLGYFGLWVYISASWSVEGHFFVTLIVPLIFVLAWVVMLVVAAMRNMRQYQERSLWLFVGTLYFSSDEKAAQVLSSALQLRIPERD